MKYFIVSIVIIISYMIVTAHRNKLVSHTITAPLSKDFTLFFISDVHNRTINQNMLAKVGTVDAVIIGGDFCDKRTPLTKVEKNIKRLAACGKVYFVWGNNDRELEEAQLRALYQRCGVTIVENNAIPLTDKLWLSAIEDTSSRNYSFEQAFAKVPSHSYTIFVSHNPAVFPRVIGTYPMHLALAGHWHGGQIRFGKLGVRPKGRYQVIQGVPTLISNGYGTTLVPLRLGALPEAHIITLQAMKMYNKNDNVKEC